MRIRTWQLLGICLYSISCSAQASSWQTCIPTIQHANGPVEARAKSEDKFDRMVPNFFGLTAYKPNYALPFYYTGSPDNVAYQNLTPINERLSHAEVKYQISLKVPIWKYIAHHSSSIYFAYTQLSYWQLYNTRAFVRENDYEPELFLANEPNWCLGGRWHLNFLNVGADHQSNGYGDGSPLERSWNRFYVDAIASNDNWMISLKPWYIISTNVNNTNIGNYLGHGRLLVAYKIHQHVISLETHNLIEGGARRATAQLTYSFPLIPYLKGYVQIFSGYGQSLIEYNHRTNSAGIGLALSDWI